jgi:alternate signal-mediated exported protein
MNRLFKGAIAGGAGIALLLGGAGTFAMWQDSTELGSAAQITAGELRFGAPDEMPRAVWTVNGQPVADIDALRLVPGDEVVITFEDVPVIARGTYLAAEFGVDLANLIDGSAAQTRAFLAALDYTVSVSGFEPAPGESTVAVPVEDGLNLFDVVITITFDRNSNDTEAYAGTVTLEDIALTITQVPHEFHATG